MDGNRLPPIPLSPHTPPSKQSPGVGLNHPTMCALIHFNNVSPVGGPTPERVGLSSIILPDRDNLDVLTCHMVAHRWNARRFGNINCLLHRGAKVGGVKDSALHVCDYLDDCLVVRPVYAQCITSVIHPEKRTERLACLDGGPTPQRVGLQLAMQPVPGLPP